MLVWTRGIQLASDDPYQSPDSTQSSRQVQGIMAAGAAEGSLKSRRVRGHLLSPHEISGSSSSDEDDMSEVKTMSTTAGSSRCEPVSLQQFSQWQWYRGRIRDVRIYIQTEYKLGHSPRARNWMETASTSSMKVPLYLALGGFDHSILYLPMEWNGLNKELLRLREMWATYSIVASLTMPPRRRATFSLQGLRRREPCGQVSFHGVLAPILSPKSPASADCALYFCLVCLRGRMYTETRLSAV